MRITKQNSFAVTAAFVFVLGINSSAKANTVVLTTDAFSDTSLGGEFVASVASTTVSVDNIDLAAYASTTTGVLSSVNQISSSDPKTFQTFCLESNVVFYPGTPYTFTDGQIAKENGGTLTLGTAYLYAEFASGQLSIYNYSTTNTGANNPREVSALGLQWAIWYLGKQDEPDSSNPITMADLTKYGATAYLNWLTTETGLTWEVNGVLDQGTAFGANGSTYAVDAMVLTNSAGTLYYQDQLVMTGAAPKPPTPSVPDGGATATLLGMAFGGLAFFKRKFA